MGVRAPHPTKSSDCTAHTTADLDQHCALPPPSSHPRMTKVRASKTVRHPDERGSISVPGSVLLESEKLSWLRVVMSI